MLPAGTDTPGDPRPAAAGPPGVAPRSLPRMPESIETYAARVAAAQDAEGRLGLEHADVTGWDVFPFEPEGLRLRPGPTLAAEEAPREGEDPADCRCRTGAPRGTAEPFGIVWEHDDWLLRLPPPSGSPLVLSATTRCHLDVPDLPNHLASGFGRLQAAAPQRDDPVPPRRPGPAGPPASGFGRLQVAVIAAVEALPSVQRCHLLRIGDGGAHAHWWFVARPTRMPQLRGSFMVDWDDFLPPVPQAVQHENAAFVVDLVSRRFGGRVVDG